MGDKNGSDWLDDFIIMSMMEEDEAEASGTSGCTGASSGTTNESGCSTIFIALAAIYVILNLLAN